jgi:D-sedoheptulose 7-phosphate isomerase
VRILQEIKKKKGRLFILGVGGGAGHASHAVNDFRKIADIEAYTPVDNVAELTARINDDGWDSSFANWLKTSRLKARDGILVFSVGGGDRVRRISVNLVAALEYAKETGSKIIGIVGKDGGYTAEAADAVILIPAIEPKNITVYTESFQAVVWHLLVSHPGIQTNAMKWESEK